MFTYKRESRRREIVLYGVFIVLLDIDDSDVNFQEAEIDGYMLPQ